MFANLFFLILVLALINFVPEVEPSLWISSSFHAFEVGWLFYGLFLLGIYLQIKGLARWVKISPDFLLTVMNLELLIFLCFYYFGLGAHRLLTEGPLMSQIQTPFSLFSLLLYMGGLGWTHYWLAHFHFVPVNTSLRIHTYTQLQFLFPFCLPFIIFRVLFDSLNFIPQWSIFIQQTDDFSLFLLFGLSLISLLVILIFMPPLLIACWRCQPLRDPFILSKLQAVCDQVHFKHAGIKIWTILRRSFTAAIIGIVPRFRYVMFTQNLINQFSVEELEAILTHEIGHSRYKHLLFYPFILLGMAILGAFLSLFYTDPLARYFMYQNTLYPSEIWSFLFPFSLFSIYAILLGIYFRFIFGFFSRLFERQADLNIFDYALSPTYLIQALDHIALATGNTHRHPSWHHYSIQERINFLHSAMANPILVAQHHRRVKRWLVIYFSLLILSCLALYWVPNYTHFT